MIIGSVNTNREAVIQIAVLSDSKRAHLTVGGSQKRFARIEESRERGSP
jgi:hypothetical protein